MGVVKCGYCGMDNQEGVLNCVKCGNVLYSNNLGATSINSQQININNTGVNQEINTNSNIAGGQVLNANNTNTNVLGNGLNNNLKDINMNNTNSMEVTSIGSVQPVNIQTNDASNNTGKKQKGLKWLLIVMIILLVAVIGIAVWVFFLGQDKLKLREEMLENRIEILWTPGSTNSYSVGSEVTLIDNSSWYVLGQNGDKVTLLSSINYSDKVNNSNIIDKINSDILPGIVNNLENNGGNVDDLVVRTLSINEIRNIAGVLSTEPNSNISVGISNQWLVTPNEYLVSSDDGYVYVVWSLDEVSGNYKITEQEINNAYYIRIVIELDKSNIK